MVHRLFQIVAVLTTAIWQKSSISRRRIAFDMIVSIEDARDQLTSV